MHLSLRICERCFSTRFLSFGSPTRLVRFGFLGETVSGVAVTPEDASFFSVDAALWSSAHTIGQRVMGVAVKDRANGKLRRLRRGQLVGGRKLSTNTATSVAGHLRVILQRKKEPLFHLATEWLPDMTRMARLEALNPPERPAI